MPKRARDCRSYIWSHKAFGIWTSKTYEKVFQRNATVSQDIKFPELKCAPGIFTAIFGSILIKD